jgi:hypothetical protein
MENTMKIKQMFFVAFSFVLAAFSPRFAVCAGMAMETNPSAGMTGQSGVVAPIAGLNEIAPIGSSRNNIMGATQGLSLSGFLLAPAAPTVKDGPIAEAVSLNALVPIKGNPILAPLPAPAAGVSIFSQEAQIGISQEGASITPSVASAISVGRVAALTQGKSILTQVTSALAARSNFFDSSEGKAEVTDAALLDFFAAAHEYTNPNDTNRAINKAFDATHQSLTQAQADLFIGALIYKDGYSVTIKNHIVSTWLQDHPLAAAQVTDAALKEFFAAVHQYTNPKDTNRAINEAFDATHQSLTQAQADRFIQALIYNDGYSVTIKNHIVSTWLQDHPLGAAQITDAALKEFFAAAHQYTNPKDTNRAINEAFDATHKVLTEAQADRYIQALIPNDEYASTVHDHIIRTWLKDHPLSTLKGRKEK